MIDFGKSGFIFFNIGLANKCEATLFSLKSCGIELTEPRVVHHKKLIKPYTHWSHQCKTCNMFQCVKTGKFTLTNIELRNQHNEIAGKKPVKPYGPPPGNAKIGRPLGAKNKKKSVLLDK